MQMKHVGRKDLPVEKISHAMPYAYTYGIGRVRVSLMLREMLILVRIEEPSKAVIR